MNIIIKTKNLELAPKLKNFVDKKITSLEKYIKSTEVCVEAEKETKHHLKGKIFLVRIKMILPGKNLVASCREDDLLKAVAGAKDELKMEIEKYKFKNIDKNRREERKTKRGAL